LITPTETSVPSRKLSIIISLSSLYAVSIAIGNSSSVFTFEIPKLEPDLFGFTKI
jgi:hypothetical protein